ncbi:MATE efflux family [Micractinium conductrix]|uniref:Protein DETOXIFICATION n=1 Tax=Micractinium conductrix TaxID=554055 RepID=A0A2P6VBU8_9CHLO|nr:MATE efflux family [Micractinium conductrix]|eukprot:PSC71531.1 MATE efflux family [Micractinium conductrix]
MSLTNLAGFCIGLIPLGVTGRLGQFELSSAVLGTSIFNVTGLSVLMGFTAAMETFCGQAYGARNFRLVGIVYQRALLLTTLVTAVMALAWTQAEPLLLLLRQDPLLSRSAALYLRLCIPAMFGQSVYEASKRYLLAQGVVHPQTAVTLVGLALAPLYSWLFIFYLDLRLAGAAVAVDATQVTMALLLGAYIAFRDGAVLRGLPHATWHGWSRDALRGWRAYLRFALPSVAMICSEWWMFECVILMSGWLPEPDVAVAVMGICINTSGLVWMVVTGFSLGCSTRVGNSLGAGHPRTARRSAWTAAAITTCVELAAACGIVALRHSWAYVFTDAPDAVALTASLLPIFALSLPGDGLNATLQGLLRGAGRQETGAITNLCSYWLLGVPMAAYLAFWRGLGVHGLWWGLVIINTCQGTLMTIIALRFDFNKEAAKAAARTLDPRRPAPALSLDGGGSLDVACRGSDPMGREHSPGSSLLQPLLGGQQCGLLEGGQLAPAAPPVAPG